MKTKKLFLLLAMVFAFTACNAPAEESAEQPAQETEAPAEETQAEETDTTEPSFEGTAIELRRSYEAPHGDQAFASVGVVLEGDKILDASIDEFQFGDDTFEAVPNSDANFANGYAEGKVLYSKSENDDKYSDLMKEMADATASLEDNYEAIEEFVTGKTIGEVQATIDASTPGEPVDAVTGATFVDTVGYLEAIVNTAKEGHVSKGAYDPSSSEEVEIERELSKPHGDMSFADIMVATQGDTVVAASIDEFQFMEGQGVPNSDNAFGDGYADPNTPLVSKLENDEAYSALMTEKAQATKTLSEGYIAIQNYVVGKNAEELMKEVDSATPGEPMDAISSSTLVDTPAYVRSIAEIVD